MLSFVLGQFAVTSYFSFLTSKQKDTPIGFHGVVVRNQTVKSREDS